jgi:hypothetical protein
LNRLLTVATFDDAVSAHIAAGRLQADGLYCEIVDEHLVQTDWLAGPAVGGIKLRVPAEHAQRALAILAQDHSGDLEDLE